MQKIIILITLLFSLSMAESVLLVKKGWQLIGSSIPLANISKFTKENVEQVWHFDATTQKWLAFSPDSTIQNQMSKKNIGKLSQLKNWHGFWIKSKKEWTMVFEDKTLSSEPANSKNADIIELKKGWNLISLPVDTVLSANIFDGMTAWKYNENKWELSDPSQEDSSFPKLGHIKNSDGIWVNAKSDKKISVSKEASKLHSFKNDASVEAYIKEMATLNQRTICGIEPLVARDNTRRDLEVTYTSEPITATNTSETNLQENNVDESDILKHNGKYVFYVGKSNGRRNHINIASFETLAKQSNNTLGKISFSKNHNIDSFYLNNNKLTVLSFVYEDTSRSVVSIFDVTDINDIKKISEHKLDGSLKNSRVINDKLYLISSFNPRYKIEYPKEYLTPSSTCQEYLTDAVVPDTQNQRAYADCYNIIKDENGYFRYNYDKANITVTQLLPKIEGTNLSKQNLVTAERLYASAKKKQTTTMSSISQFSLEAGTYINTTSFIGNSSLEYASSKSLYLVSNEYPHYYDFNNYKSRSSIYKFNFDEDLSYKAVGAVYGTALNQFSLSEHNDILRIATTEGFSWGNTETKNSLYTLKENNALLEIEGILTGLGKEGETIKSVRFMGTKAYLVTFKTTDPLYTIDLSNPKSPKKMGELQVNGYSAYLHPIGNDKLLGIGQDTDSEGRRQGVKIELFDISDFKNPSSLDSITLEKGSYSELERNHKALAYRSSDHLFAFPFTNNAGASTNHLGIYQVENNSLKSYEKLNANDTNWGEHRGLIFDLNNTTYISFFSDDTVITKKLTTKEN
jgi:uncharacterized secreted protein with C-terminal beta-propeller domain